MERPILFSGPMVQAILAGRKSQTRRVLKPQPLHHPIHGYFLPTQKDYTFADALPVDSSSIDACTPHSVGDLLWVREAWRVGRGYDEAPGSAFTSPRVHFEADGGAPEWAGRYRHARFMPRWASRITLRVTAVKVERLHDISEEDAIAEGVEETAFYDAAEHKVSAGASWSVGRLAFADLWSSINGPGSWQANPWVAAYSFERVR